MKKLLDVHSYEDTVELAKFAKTKPVTLTPKELQSLCFWFLDAHRNLKMIDTRLRKADILIHECMP